LQPLQVRSAVKLTRQRRAEECLPLIKSNDGAAPAEHEHRLARELERGTERDLVGRRPRAGIDFETRPIVRVDVTTAHKRLEVRERQLRLHFVGRIPASLTAVVLKYRYWPDARPLN